MQILLIGNFAPPFEEENLYNLSLFTRLEEDGHKCSVINISDKPSVNSTFNDTGNYIHFVFTLIRLCFRKDVIHFSTKGYLRLGLLKLMTSILLGRIMGAKTFITIHSELFSIAGQMRSPVGGRQTLFTSFTIANKIICADQDTYDVASMYMKKSNFELIPSFIYAPPSLLHGDSPDQEKLFNNRKTIVFSNVKYPSLLFEILKELISNYPFPAETCIAITLAENPSSQTQKLLENMAGNHLSNMVFISPDDLQSTLKAYARADILLRPMSCDGMTFFENFAIAVKKLMHLREYIYFPSGLLFVKEGSAAELCLCIINTMLCVESGVIPESEMKDSYDRIRTLYEE